jgi:hypothetical protein
MEGKGCVGPRYVNFFIRSLIDDLELICYDDVPEFRSVSVVVVLSLACWCLQLMFSYLDSFLFLGLFKSTSFTVECFTSMPFNIRITIDFKLFCYPVIL